MKYNPLYSPNRTELFDHEKFNVIPKLNKHPQHAPRDNNISLVTYITGEYTAFLIL